MAPSMKLMRLGAAKCTSALPDILLCPGFQANQNIFSRHMEGFWTYIINIKVILPTTAFDRSNIKYRKQFDR